MYAFDYHRAASVADAAARLAADGDACLLAGGMTLIPTLKQRLASHSVLIDLAHCVDLRGVRREGAVVTIGAMTSHAAVAADATVRAALPALAALAGSIGDPHVRNRGTLGGSVANNDPAADYPAACLALNAEIVTNRRVIAADAFFVGLFETALDQGEIITAVRFQIPRVAAYQKFPNPASRYALAGVMVACCSAGTRVAVTGAGRGGAFRAMAMEQALTARLAPEAVTLDAIAEDDLIGDIHAAPDYRRHLIGVMARRAVAACL